MARLLGRGADGTGALDRPRPLVRGAPAALRLPLRVRLALAVRDFCLDWSLVFEAMAVQSPRLLHARSEFGYTDRLVQALRDEPEAVPADFQLELTRQAARRALNRRRAAWLHSRPELDRHLEFLRAELGPEFASDLRAAGRIFERMDRALAASG